MPTNIFFINNINLKYHSKKISYLFDKTITLCTGMRINGKKRKKSKTATNNVLILHKYNKNQCIDYNVDLSICILYYLFKITMVYWWM